MTFISHPMQVVDLNRTITEHFISLTALPVARIIAFNP